MESFTDARSDSLRVDTRPVSRHANAVAEYLAEMVALARSDRPVVRWHRFDEVAVVASRVSAEFVDADAAAARGIAVFERSSGGGPVLLTPDLLALAIAVPTGHPLWRADVTESYAWLGWALAGVLHDLGVPVRTVSVAEARAEDPQIGRMACFAGRSPYEVFAGESKVWGIAQHRTRTTALFVAGLYLAGDPVALADLLRGPADGLATVRHRLGAVATLAKVAPGCPAADVVTAVERDLRALGLTSSD